MGSHFEMMVSYLTADELTADVRLYSQWRGGAPLGREAFIVLDSGGVFTEGPWKPWDIGLHRHRRRSDSGCRGGEHPADRSASHPPVGEAIGTLAI
jgi:hypothetical protein